jgi:hypothetical protein
MARTATRSSTKTSGRKPRAARSTKERISALDAAARIVSATKKPMTVGEIVARAEEKGLWKSPAGKTPAATVSAAINREIAAKGKDSRFKRADRGLYAAGRRAGR